jgi:hypothetical protein
MWRVQDRLEVRVTPRYLKEDTSSRGWPLSSRVGRDEIKDRGLRKTNQVFGFLDVDGEMLRQKPGRDEVNIRLNWQAMWWGRITGCRQHTVWGRHNNLNFPSFVMQPSTSSLKPSHLCMRAQVSRLKSTGAMQQTHWTKRLIGHTDSLDPQTHRQIGHTDTDLLDTNSLDTYLLGRHTDIQWYF